MTIQFDDKGKFFTDIITKIPVLSKIQTPTHLIRGKIHVRRGQRIKDELDNDEPFLAITDATVFDAQNQPLYECEFMAVYRAHIIWVIPEEEPPLDEDLLKETP